MSTERTPHDPHIIFRYLRDHAYPARCSLSRKRSIRRAAKNNFKLERGELMYRRLKKKINDVPGTYDDADQDGELHESPWRKVLMTPKQIDDALANLHSSALDWYRSYRASRRVKEWQ
ncbi:uncharacterized protein LOC135495032 [Lineus longissimus]|uniref:uncharacterized protein LOC135495032 n=1 Tax=Lineus longissimus TaxID=88925 RepID=UPI00315DAF30